MCFPSFSAFRRKPHRAASLRRMAILKIVRFHSIPSVPMRMHLHQSSLYEYLTFSETEKSFTPWNRQRSQRMRAKRAMTSARSLVDLVCKVHWLPSANWDSYRWQQQEIFRESRKLSCAIRMLRERPNVVMFCSRGRATNGDKGGKEKLSYRSSYFVSIKANHTCMPHPAHCEEWNA